MALIQWHNSYSVGIDTIDKQHKSLLELINELNDAMLNRQTQEVLKDILSGLIDYTHYHFAYEEKYFEKYNYPQTFTHKMEHQKFIKKVHAFEKEFKEGKLILSVEIMNFLRDWIVNHIHGTDKKYSSFFADKNLD